MKKKFSPLYALLLISIFFGCDGTNTMKMQFNTNVSEVRSRLKQMMIDENFQIESDDSLMLATVWRKATKEENNIPDNTIEVKLEASLQSIETGSEVIFKATKRSTLDSQNGGTSKYTEVGIILNDMLYRKWSDKLKSLQEEYKKK